MKDSICVLIDREREREAAMKQVSYLSNILIKYKKMNRKIESVYRSTSFAHYSALAILSMLSCIHDRRRLAALAIVLGVGLIIAAVAIRLSVGLTQKRTKSHTTTGSYRVNAILP